MQVYSSSGNPSSPARQSFWLKSALAIALLAGAVSPTWAQFAKAEDAVKYRKASFSLMAHHFSQIGAVVKGEKPFNAAEVAANAALVETLAKLPWNAFPAGSESVSDSKAKAEIWKEADKFKAGADKLQADVAKLNVAAKSSDLAAIKTAFGAVGQSCKTCHDSYKNK
ncbi:c-type cytochrome [Parvibium lacunae]|uniref:Cytochrome c n=1 Tax=Parvibium lacunae TaxID=1888893 RepID=A0A368L026_9BURK|nr:cytochrome c [Parvibium lacunae]RCS56772.1 cytochrome c [Parvibium lacunae]